jgi:hypothetical protein
MGTEIWSLTGPRATELEVNAGYKTGTSMAAPQVAGVAAYLWALAPQLSPQEVKAIILHTAQAVPECTGPGESVPVIDAYAAVLAADRGGSLAVRRTLLDVADAEGLSGTNGRFDAWDVAVLKSELEAANGATDYSRFDLNGDGNTGGPARRRFDLDANELPAYSHLTRTIGGGSRDFDESALTDLDVLCYYAFSPLFQVVSGLASAADLLGDNALPADGALRAGGPPSVSNACRRPRRPCPHGGRRPAPSVVPPTRSTMATSPRPARRRRTPPTWWRAEASSPPCPARAMPRPTCRRSSRCTPGASRRRPAPSPRSRST